MLKGLERLERKRKLLEKWAPKTSESNTAPALKRTTEQMPEWGLPLLEPKRYKALYGGRGGGKSVAVADALLTLATRSPIRILCCREYQNSIRDSSHYLLAERIDELGFSSVFDVQRDRIVGANGSEFLFKGVRHNISSIKSMASINICWVEEAQTISAESWRILIPTIRADNSEIWVTFNPSEETDPVYQEFVTTAPENAYVRAVNWSDNPYFPSVLNDERLKMQASDPDAYQHIWEGQLWSKSDAQIFKDKWIVEAFEPGDDWHGPYFGADFGFAKDPTTLSKSWIHGDRLYIERESYHVGLDIDATSTQWARDIPGYSAYEVRADSARPDSISYLRRHGVPRIIGAVKGKGSIEDGIAYLRHFEKIVIHPQCPKTIEEFRLYRYKVDAKSEQILPVVVDAYNHIHDSLRYGQEPMMKAWKERRLESDRPKRRSRWRG